MLCHLVVDEKVHLDSHIHLLVIASALLSKSNYKNININLTMKA